MSLNRETAYGKRVLPSGIRSRRVERVNGLSMHVLEAGFESTGRPLLLLLHGFPELAFSWRKQLLPLAQAGFHVVAPDQRGYGLTTGWDPDYDGDFASFRLFNVAKDAIALVHALGYRKVASVIGHDFGSPVAAWCSLLRPDIFESTVLMSAPFEGPPPLADRHQQSTTNTPDVHRELAQLSRPRKHYQWYYSSREANDNMAECPQGIHAFLRAYFRMKSGDWPDNNPYPLKAWRADELAKLPDYYVMPLELGMAETVAPAMPSPQEIESCAWLNEAELAVYSERYSKTGFQGGLQWYRCGTQGVGKDELELFHGRTIDQPSLFIAGQRDWGTYQKAGAFEAMQRSACAAMQPPQLVPQAGHWVQQEQPEAVNRLLLDFLDKTPR